MRWRVRHRLTRLLIAVFSFGPVARAIEESQRRPKIWGDESRVHIDPTAFMENTTINVNSGHVTVGAHSFFGQEAMLTTGRHAFERVGLARHPFRDSGCDIEIGKYVWVASRAIVVGPCKLGDNAVVAAGAVVTGDVESGAIVGGVPARLIRYIEGFDGER